MRIVSLLCLLGIGLFTSALAEPFIPASTDSVLERLAPPPPGSSHAQLRQLRTALLQTPTDLEAAAQLSRLYIEQARLQGDPRYLGHAQAILSPWWEDPQPPIQALLLRAILRQSNHEFEAALADLDQVINRQPTNAQAWLTRASLYQVRGDYAAARSDCRKLLRLSHSAIAHGCLASIASLSGQGKLAYTLLQQQLTANTGLTANEQQWLQGLLAEIAYRRGDYPTAERHFQHALSTTTADTYLLGAYADALLDAGRPQAVIELLSTRAQADTLLLRLAIAEQRLQRPTANNRIEELSARFAAARQRGDAKHLREEARYYLELRRQPDTALDLAQANWKLQREPADAHLLLAAALASGDEQAALPVLNWMRDTGIDAVQLTALAQALETTGL